MWNTRHQFLENNYSDIYTKSRYKGFVLSELIIVIGIYSIFLASFYSILDITNKSMIFADNEDEILLQGRYIIDYIKNEVKEADMIIASYNILNLDSTYPENIGFVLLEDKGESNIPINQRYRFYTYYLKNDKLIRISTNKDTSDYPIASDLRGFNEMCEDVLSINDTNMDFENKLLELRLSFGKDGKEAHCFKSTTFINNIVDY